MLIEPNSRRQPRKALLCLLLLPCACLLPRLIGETASRIRFELKPIAFRLEHGEVKARMVAFSFELGRRKSLMPAQCLVQPCIPA